MGYSTYYINAHGFIISYKSNDYTQYTSVEIPKKILIIFQNDDLRTSIPKLDYETHQTNQLDVFIDGLTNPTHVIYYDETRWYISNFNSKNKKYEKKIVRKRKIKNNRNIAKTARHIIKQLNLKNGNKPFPNTMQFFTFEDYFKILKYRKLDKFHYLRLNKIYEERLKSVNIEDANTSSIPVVTTITPIVPLDLPITQYHPVDGEHVIYLYRLKFTFDDREDYINLYVGQTNDLPNRDRVHRTLDKTPFDIALRTKFSNAECIILQSNKDSNKEWANEMEFFYMLKYHTLKKDPINPFGMNITKPPNYRQTLYKWKRQMKNLQEVCSTFEFLH